MKLWFRVINSCLPAASGIALLLRASSIICSFTCLGFISAAAVAAADGGGDGGGVASCHTYFL